MNIGLGLGLPFALRGAGASIRALFANGEQGFWYDYSDLSTLFQDSAGTSPVTAVGQPVGLSLDKRLGLMRGPQISPDPEFDLGFAGSIGAPVAGRWHQNTTSATYEISGGALRFNDTPSTYGPTQSVFATASWYEVIVNIESVAQGAVRIVANGTTLVSRSSAGPMSCILQAQAATLGIAATGVTTAVVSSVSVRELPGNHATQPTAINRPVLQIDGNGKYYLAFNGTNQWMQTAAIDLTATSKMTVVAGVRTIGTARGILCQNGNPAPGVDGLFSLEAPGFTGNAYIATISKAASNGDALSSVISVPSADILTAAYDGGATVTEDAVKLRRNGNLTKSSAADVPNPQVFSNAALFIGARAGSNTFLNGNIYGLIIRGALSSDPQIASAERFMSRKTGVAL